MLSLLGILSQINWQWGNAAWASVIVVCLYYFRFRSFKVYAAFFSQIIPMLLFIHFNPLGSVSFYCALFFIGWVAQFVGHHVEGKKPSFVEDLQFLLIGPLWIVKNIFWRDLA